MSAYPNLPIVVRIKEIEDRLLTALSNGWSISYALRVAGMARTYFDKLLKTDDAFAFAVSGAINEGKDYKEDRAKARAFEGYEKPIFHKGIQVGSEWKASDTLALAILKADRPERFARRHETSTVTMQHTGPNGGPIEVVATRVAPKDRAKAVAALLAGASAAELASVLGGQP